MNEPGTKYLHVLQRYHWFCPLISFLSLVLPAYIFPITLNYAPLQPSPLFVTYTAHAQSPALLQALTAKLWLLLFLILWLPDLEQPPPARQALRYSLLLEK